MNIFGIIIFIIISAFLIVSFIVNIVYTKRIKALLKREELLNKQFIENANKPLYIGKINKYTEKDLLFFGKNLEFVNLVLKVLEYQIAIKTDTMRNTGDGTKPEEKAGYLNALHSIHLFFYKILNKKEKDNNYSGKDLL